MAGIGGVPDWKRLAVDAGRVVAVVHLEDVLVGEPAGRGRPDALDDLAPRVEEGEAGRAEQVLEHAGGEEVDAQLLHVERQRAGALVRVQHDERAALVRDARDLLHVDARAVPVADVRDRDDRRVVVDLALEALERESSRQPSASTWTTRAPRSSCACQIWPTVGNSQSVVTIFERRA